MRPDAPRFRLLERLGGGSAGEVYRAEDLVLGRIVALKLLAERPRTDAPWPTAGEALAAARLNHPGIVAVHELTRFQDRPCIVMEHVDGETLAERLARGALPIREALDVVIGAAEALDAAHAGGVVHGDVKSANLLLPRAGGVKLADFGLARCGSSTDMSEPGFAGTLGYAAPERLAGQPPDATSDLFALGVVLFEAASGRRPHDGGDAATVVDAVLRGDPPPLSRFRDDAPLDLEGVVRRALHKEPRARYASARAFADALREIRSKLSPRAGPPARSGVEVAETGAAAFRGLLPYQEADRERFYAREADAAALVARVTHAEFRFGVLFGESGCGKTSLLRAAVVPRLWERGRLPIYVRAGADPVSPSLAECARRTGVRPQPDEEPFAYFVRIARQQGCEVVLIWDQLEELLTAPAAGATDPVLALLRGLHASSERAVRCLVAIRSDRLHLVGSELSSAVPEPLAIAGLHHLRHLDLRQAREVIERSARHAGLELAPELVAQVARDLAEADGVRTPELQIVGEQLERRRMLKLADYRAAGGKEALLYAFVEDVLQASGDAPATSRVLLSLIAGDDTRLAASAEEVRERAGLGSDAVRRCLRQLVGARLVQERQGEAPERYELVHESLVERIHRATSRLTDESQRASRLLAQHASAYAVDRGARVPPRHLWLIARHAAASARAPHRELLRRSLRRVLLRAGLLTAGVALAALAAAAALSITVEWPEARLRDGHTAAVRRAVYSPDGRLFVSVGEDGKVVVWDAARRERLRTLPGHHGFVPSVAFAPDGSRFATAGADRRVIVWRTATLEREAELLGHDDPVNAVAFSADGSRLASADARRTLLWATSSWERIGEIPKGQVWGNLLFSRDGRLLVFAVYERAWDLEAGHEAASPVLPGGSWTAFSPDGETAAGTQGVGTLRLVDLRGRKATRESRPHRFHARGVAYSLDGRLLATAAEDIGLFDARSANRLARLTYRSEAWSVDFSPDGRFLLAGYQDGEILVWDVAEREPMASLREHQGPVPAVAFSPDGRYLASTGDDRSVRVWDTWGGHMLARLDGHANRVRALAWAPLAAASPTHSLLTCDQDGRVVFWDVAARAPRWRVPVPPRWSCYAAAVKPDGRFAATTRGVYDSASGRLVEENAFGHLTVYGLAFSPDGRTLAAATELGDLVLSDTGRWSPRDRRHLPDTHLIAVAWSPDGRFLVTGEDEGALRVWQAEPLAMLYVLGRHAARVKSVAWSPDGREVASAGDDQELRLWDVASRRPIARIGDHTSPVLSVAFAPDGRRLASGSQDGSVRIFTRRRTLWGRVLP